MSSGFRKWGASAAAMLGSLLSNARTVSDHIFPLPLSRRVAGRPMWVAPRVDRRRGKPAGAKHRRKASERTFGLSPRGH